jgi:dTMP kinase
MGDRPAVLLEQIRILTTFLYWMWMRMRRSMFITFEGIDFSGKTTQAGLAVERLRQSGKEVLFVREPGGTGLSERIRSILLEKTQLDIGPVSELLLFNAARAQLVREVILPSLRAGTIVVCDRFYDSTTAYQGYGRSLPLEAVKAVNAFASGGTAPDLTLFVDVGPEEIGRRKTSDGHSPDRMEEAGDDFYAKVVRGYKEIAREEPSRVVVVSGDGTIEQTQAAIWAHIEQRLTARENQ